ncbi:MAG: hypothetical protein IT539_13775 [Bradyrhizobiaceae bacterium]|nr:hypothetical protein [Bradyrhizobiaceae bacterium]
MTELTRPAELAASIQANMDELAGIIAAQDPELVAPAVEQVLADAVRHSGRWRQDQLFWIADEVLRRARACS